MIDVMDAKDLFLSHFAAFEKTLGRGEAGWLRALRSAAMEQFAEQGFPTTHDEEWRFTPLNKLEEIPFQLADPNRVIRLSAAETSALALPSEASHQLVLTNGRFAADHLAVSAIPPGVIVCSLAIAIREHRELVEPHLARHADAERSPFVALNSAFLSDGLFVFLPRGTVLRETLYLMYLTHPMGESVVHHPRTLIVCEENSQANIVQSYLGSINGEPEDTTFTNAVTEIIVGPNAHLEHCKVQRENRHAIHFETLQVRQDRGSHFASQAVTLGAALARNEINAVLAGEHCQCTLNGLYVAGGTQHVDNRTSIDHAMPHCDSHELYKGILDGKSKGVFNGKIFVRQDAQKTDAKQTNRTLLLSDEATINSKPQLEIFADDVKCTHGATVGQLAEEALFYLRSRGIGMEQARAVLTYAFADEILQHIKVATLRRDLEGHFLAAQHLPADLREEEAP